MYYTNKVKLKITIKETDTSFQIELFHFQCPCPFVCTVLYPCGFIVCHRQKSEHISSKVRHAFQPNSCSANEL